MAPPSVLPQGSTILVTGANGFVASHVVEELLKLKDADYKVRGTARSADKLEKLQKRWNQEFGEGRFEIAVVPDLLKEGALDDAMKGVSAVTHVASVVSFSGVTAEVVDPTVKMTLEALKSAAKVSTIKRFVLTSSTAAVFNPPGTADDHITESTWNEEAKVKARELPANDPSRPLWVYCASKIEGEQAAWEFVKKEKPCFEFNAVMPNLVIGKILDEASQKGSTAGWCRDVFNGKIDMAKNFPPQWFVSAEDTALVHVGALTLPQVAGQRVFACAGPYNWDSINAVYRKLYPSREFKDFQSAKDESKIDNARGAAILKEFGRDGWQSLESALESLVGREQQGRM